MIDWATWITGGASGLAALFSLYFAIRADRAQSAAAAARREANQAAREAAESADKAQRIYVRPALHVESQQQRGPAVDGTPAVIRLAVRNVGHGTAVIEHVKLFQYGNLGVEFCDTRGFEQKINEQFDEQIFVPLAGLRMESAPAWLTIPTLTDSTRALEAGATRVIFSLSIGTPGFANILRRFGEGLTAQVFYRSLAGDKFNTDQQFADLREQEADVTTEAANQ